MRYFNIAKTAKTQREEVNELANNENADFDNACRDAGLNGQARGDFSQEFHQDNFRAGIGYQAIKSRAQDWWHQNKHKYDASGNRLRS